MKQFDHGGTVFAVARQLGVPPELILDFSASINPLGPVPGVREAVARAFDLLVHYPDSEVTELRAALASLHGLVPEQICVANGSTELIYLMPRLVAGRRGLIVAPPFSEYAKSLARAGWEAEYFDLSPEDGFALDPAALDERLAAGYDLLFLCNPGNPTGRLIPLSEMKHIVDICRQRGVFLVIDEAFMDFCEEESVKQLVADREGVLVLRSMTKFYAVPGLRLGYAVGGADLIGRLAALREPWSVNTLAQVAGVASLADRDYPRRTREYVAAARAEFSAGLAALPGYHPFASAANYLLVEYSGVRTVAELREVLLARGILIRDCGSFRGLGKRFFRVAVRSVEENRRLLEVLGTV